MIMLILAVIGTIWVVCVAWEALVMLFLAALAIVISCGVLAALFFAFAH